MTREEFSGLLTEARSDCGAALIDICAATRMLPKDIYRIERAKNSYNMQKSFDYLKAVSHKMVLSYKNKLLKVDNYQSFVSSLTNARIESGHTQRSLVSAIGCSRTAIANAERGSSIMSVDTFLKIADALEIDIKIEKL